MKKIIKLIIAIFILVLILQWISYLFKSSHEITYNLKADDINYTIEEVYKDQKYYFKITNKNYQYSFEVDNDFHKRKKIINKIYYFNKDNINCIYPVIKNSVKTNILCSDKKQSYAYTYFQNDLAPFIKTLQENNYYSPSWQKMSNKSQKLETLTAYQNSFPENTNILIYKYNGFYAISKKKLENIILFENDSYKNPLGTKLDKYYIIPNYDQKYDYSELYTINMKSNKVKKRELSKEISKDSYINGVVDNEIYLFDRDELKQYKIFKNGKKIKEVGNKEKGVLYYNLKFTTKDVYSFRDNNLTFKTFEDYISKIEKNTSIKYLQKTNDSYYYQTKDNNVYYYNTNNKLKVLLFNKKISDFILEKDTLYFISDDTLYSYSFQSGIKKLLTYSELSFNSDNRLAIYME